MAIQRAAAQSKDAQVTLSRETLAEAIAKLGDGVDKALRSGINQKAIVTLLQAETKLPRKTIERVLESMKDLHRIYCR